MRASYLLFTCATLALINGCSGGSASEPDANSSSTTATLIADNSEIESLEQDIEGSLEQPLSGATLDLKEVDASSAEEAAAAARENAGAYFEPAGCITSTREGTVVTHVFDDCRGPRGRALNGTVVSTWTRTDHGVGVLHDATDFELNDAVVDHTTSITYERLDGAYTIDRTTSTVGETAQGLNIDHAASFTGLWDPESGCLNRSGSADVTIGGREWTRQVEGWRRCGGRFVCPSAGTITLSGPRGQARIDITDAGVYDITVNERTDTSRKMLWCVAE